MNKHNILIGAVIVGLVAIIGAAVWFVFNKAADPKPAPMQPVQQITPPETTQNQAVPGSYEPYTETAFANTQAERRLLFFHAGWCPQCRALEKSIEQTGVSAGMAIFKVDFDTAQALRTKYGVTLQTTIVEVNKNGDLVKKFVAYETPNLPAVLEALQ